MGGLYVIDACQGRFEIDWLNDKVDNRSVMLLTGSKFFRGPPFSGAVIVPESIMTKISDMKDDFKMPQGLNTFIGKVEIPRELPHLRDQMKDNQNPGLAIRWVAALAEMEPTLSISAEVRQDATTKWR